jgi:hypothetical protein
MTTRDTGRDRTGTGQPVPVRLCGQFTGQPHVRCGILGTSSSHTFTTRLPHVRLCGEFTTQPHVRCDILDDNRDNVSETTLSEYPPSSFTDVHWYIGYRNPNWYSLTKFVRLTNLSEYDRRDGSSEIVLSPFQHSPRTPPSRSRVYTGVSVITT